MSRQTTDPRFKSKNLVTALSQIPRATSDCVQIAPNAEVFLVQTEKIFFLAVVHRNQQGRYHGNGYMLVTNESPLLFSIKADGTAVVRQKCQSLAQRIANLFGGTLQQGKVEDYRPRIPASLFDGRN